MATCTSPYRSVGVEALERPGEGADLLAGPPLQTVLQRLALGRHRRGDHRLPAGREAQRLAPGVDEVGGLHEAGVHEPGSWRETVDLSSR